MTKLGPQGLQMALKSCKTAQHFVKKQWARFRPQRLRQKNKLMHIHGPRAFVLLSNREKNWSSNLQVMSQTNLTPFGILY